MKEEELKLYEYNLNEIKNCIENRPSRLEDIEEILAWKQKVNKKDAEMEAMKDELKWYRL